MNTIDTLSGWIESTLGLDSVAQLKLLESALAIVVLWGIRKIVLKIAVRKLKDNADRYRWQKVSGYIVLALSIIIVGRIWFEGMHSIATFLGLLTAGIAIALKDPLVNLAGWIYIMSRRPFHLGDRIQIGDYAGDVVDIGLFQFAIMEIGNWVDADQNTGRIVYIPNGLLFSQPLGNYTEGWFEYIWTEVAVRITFESNWRKAKGILVNIAEKHGKHLSAPAQRKAQEASMRYVIFQSSVQPTVYTSVKNNGVQLSVRTLCDPRRRRHVEQAIWEEVLESFNRNQDIQFAYPTQRFYNYAVEHNSPEESDRDAPVRRQENTKNRTDR